MTTIHSNSKLPIFHKISHYHYLYNHLINHIQFPYLPEALVERMISAAKDCRGQEAQANGRNLSGQAIGR
jgi:hypothetical protein